MWSTRAAAVMLAGAIAQQGAPPPAPGQSPTFRGGVALVTIDVTVLDAEGNPVEGLTPADIDIKLDGRAQPVRAFTFVQTAMPAAAAAAAPTSKTAPPPPASTGPRAPDAPRRTVQNDGTPAAPVAAAAPTPQPASAPGVSAEPRVFVIIVDDLSYSPLRGKAMFAAAQRFLDRIPPADLAGYTTTSGIGALNPTRDRETLRQALSKVLGQFSDPRGLRRTGPAGGRFTGSDAPLGISESIDIARGDETLLKDVIIRECFNGDRSKFAGVSLAEMLAMSGPCPSDVQTEARQVAGAIGQNRARQLEGIRSVIAAMADAGGIRHLVLLSDGLPVSREVDALHPLVRAAAQAGVQVSVLMEEPDISATDEGRRVLPIESLDPPQADPGTSRRRREDDLLLVSGLQTMTEMLGGQFHRVIGTPDPFFDRVIAASSGVYRLGVELPAGARPGTSFTVTASVKRSGVTTRVNRFIVATPPKSVDVAAPAPSGPPPAVPPARSVDELLNEALAAKTMDGRVPIRMSAYVRRSRSVAGQVDVAVDVAIPAAVAGPLTTSIGVVDSHGAVRSSRRVLAPAAAGDYTASFLFPLAAGDYRVRYVVSDAAGAIGSVEIPVRAVLPPLGRFTAGDVLTWYVDAASNSARLFGLEDVPAGVTTLRASLELESAEPGAGPPAMRWTLTREGEGVPLQQHDVAPDKSDTGFRADAEFPLADLPAGRYEIRATLLDAAGQPLGSRAAVVKAGT